MCKYTLKSILAYIDCIDIIKGFIKEKKIATDVSGSQLFLDLYKLFE